MTKRAAKKTVKAIPAKQLLPAFPAPNRAMSLTERERDVLRLFALGETYVAIGEQLGISPKTVSSYLQRVREKARAKTRADVIKLAINEKLMSR